MYIHSQHILFFFVFCFFITIFYLCSIVYREFENNSFVLWIQRSHCHHIPLNLCFLFAYSIDIFTWIHGYYGNLRYYLYVKTHCGRSFTLA